MTDKTQDVYVAIADIMAEMAKEGIAKSSDNKQQGYKFRGIDAVYGALASKLAARKLLILPRVVSRNVIERETRNGGNLFYTTLEVEFDLVSGVDGSKHTIRTVGEAMDSGDKSSNKAMSAAYKYAAIQAFCIPVEGDNDVDATTHDFAPKKASVVADGNHRSGSPLVDKWVNEQIGIIRDCVDMESLRDTFGTIWKTAKKDRNIHDDQLAQIQFQYEQSKDRLAAKAMETMSA